MTRVDLQKTDEVLQHYIGERGAAIRVLQELQEAYHYLPREAMEQAAQKLDVPLSQLLRLATFFKTFSLEPQGEHCIQVCLGTACHVRGGPRLVERLGRDLGIKPGQTTKDGKFSLQVVRCIGCCGMAPAVRVDQETYGRVRQNQLGKILQRYRKDH